MHVLVVNDDGPPGPASPYVRSLVVALQAQNHTVSVVLPHKQRSYIGKAHLVDQDITTTSYYPDNNRLITTKDSTSQSVSDLASEEWLLIDSTPASCVQVGLYHHFQERGPIDLVISGPNYGRNTTAVFTLGSGTIGGALEAAACGKKAIAISFGFDDYSLGANTSIIDAASKRCVELITRLLVDWDPDVHLFNVNVPLTAEIHSAKAMYTKITQNWWTNGSCLQEFEITEIQQAGQSTSVLELPEAGLQMSSVVGGTSEIQKHEKRKVLRFVAVPEGISAPGETQEGQDSWTVDNGMISVTPLRANFMHVGKVRGEVEL